MRTTSLAALVLAAAVTGCGQDRTLATTDNASRSPDNPASSNCGLDRSEQVLRDIGDLEGYADGSPYEGLSLSEARKRAEAQRLVVRVIGEDGKCFDRALNGQGNRVNFYVEDGTVVRSVGF